jgi:O-antigen/teichoic acid export membrane protein
MLPFTLLAGISILNQRVDILMLGALTSASDVGIYNMAAQGAILVSFPLMACNAVLGPNIARLHTQNDHSRMQRLFTLSTLVISVAAAVAALVLVVGGGWFLANLFGEAFVDAYPALVILSIGQLFNAWVGSVGLFLSMTGNEKDTLKGLVSSAILSVVLNAILIPPFGIVGAAISMTLGSVTWNVILAILLYRRLGIFAGPIGGWLSKRKNAPGEP